MTRSIIEPPPEPGAPTGPLWKRLGWFVGLAVGSAVVTATVAYLLKALLH
ncbi:MAG: DUF2474 domain-containing protein [Phenylobacterium sp.]|nr:MAG: DUF2474 domain-containing protein [Phenylobacterium sp.]